MALTEELLKKSEALQGLTEPQIAAIVELSKNDEDTVVGGKYRDFLNEFDAAIKETSGVDKTTNEKTSSYLKRVLGEQKTKVEGLNTQVTEKDSKIAELEGKIASGSGDKDLIASQKATIEKLTGEYNTLKGEKDKMEADHKAALLDMRIGTELNMALNEIAFKQDANPEIVNAMKKLAIDSLKSETKPTYITDDQGAERLIFKDANGAEMRNKNNGLNFYTAKELLTEQLSKYGIVDDGKPAGGAGGGGSTPKPRTNISGARSKREFMEMAENTLHSKGLVYGTTEYQQELDRIVDDNGAVFDALPQE
jgi:hypothetical protein